ncbi:TPA: hypothetical protein ACFU2R_001426 [Neisseria subflava]
MAKVYLALYKGRKTIKTPKDLAFRIIEWVIRKVTGGQYSHCEIAVPVAFSDDLFDCYSSSFRDSGVRCKRMPLPAAKWDLIALDNQRIVMERLFSLWRNTKGKRYDLLGVLCVTSFFRRFLRQSADKWFCSEWCGEVMGVAEPSLCSPVDLAELSQGKRKAV